MNNRRDVRRLLSAVLLTAWAFIVVFFYYAAHKPFDARNAMALVSAVLDLAITGGLVWIAVGVGLCGLPRSDDVTLLEGLALGGGLGLGMAGLAVLAVGLLGGLHHGLFWTLFVVGLGVASPQAVKFLRAHGSERLAVPEGRLYRFLAMFVALMLGLALLLALTPPIAWDSLVYHLTGPKLYMEAHRVTTAMGLPYQGFPALTEMLYTAGMLLKGPMVAQLIHWAYLAFTLVLVYALARRYLDVRVGWISMALLCGVPTVFGLASAAYVDLALMFHGLAAVHCLLRWKQNRRVHWLLLTALFCGFANGTKYTAIGLSLAVGLSLLLEARSRGWRESLAHALLFGAAAGVVTLPWLLRNWAMMDNPIAPFFFDSPGWNAFQRHWYGRFGSGLAHTAPLKLLTLPWDITVHASEGKEGFGATVGPLLLIGLTALLFVWRFIQSAQRRVLALLGFIVLVQYLVWLTGVASTALLVQTRLLLPIFPLLALLAAAGFGNTDVLRRPGFAVDWLLHVILVLVLTLQILEVGLAFVRHQPLRVIAGWETRSQYLDRRLGAYWETMQFINSDLPADAKVLFWWEMRSYYCERECKPDFILDGFKYLTHTYGTASAIADHLKDEGYTHILLHRSGLDVILAARFDPINEGDLRILQELQEHYLAPVFETGDAYVVYTLKEGPGSD